MNFELSSHLGDMIGLLGVAVYLVSYLVLQLGLVSGQSMIYAAANIVAAGSVLFSLSYQFNLSSALIQSMWILISLIGISRLYFLHKTTSFTADEKTLLSSKFPGLSIDQALDRFLSLLKRLMEPNRFTGQARSAARCGASGKLCNDVR